MRSDAILTMRRKLTFLGYLVLIVANLQSGFSADAAKEFLRFVYGADNVNLEAAVWPHDDLWMLRGNKNETALAEIAEVRSRGDGILFENIQSAICYIEVRDGKVDPRFFLSQSYLHHRELVLRFVYASLTQDRGELRRLVTRPENVGFGRFKPPAGGDLDVYQDVIARMPMVRTSSPEADKVSKSVSYRVPLGSKGLNIRVVTRDGRWLVDSGTKFEVPLEFFFQ